MCWLHKLSVIRLLLYFLFTLANVKGPGNFSLFIRAFLTNKYFHCILPKCIHNCVDSPEDYIQKFQRNPQRKVMIFIEQVSNYLCINNHLKRKQCRTCMVVKSNDRPVFVSLIIWIILIDKKTLCDEFLECEDQYCVAFNRQSPTRDSQTTTNFRDLPVVVNAWRESTSV